MNTIGKIVARSVALACSQRNDQSRLAIDGSGVVLPTTCNSCKQALFCEAEPPADPSLLFDNALVDPPASFDTDLAELRRVLEGHD